MKLAFLSVLSLLTVVYAAENQRDSEIDACLERNGLSRTNVSITDDNLIDINLSGKFPKSKFIFCTFMRNVDLSNNEIEEIIFEEGFTDQSSSSSQGGFTDQSSSSSQGGFTDQSSSSSQEGSAGQNVSKWFNLIKVDLSHNKLEYYLHPANYEFPNLANIDLSFNKLGVVSRFSVYQSDCTINLSNNPRLASDLSEIMTRPSYNVNVRSTLVTDLSDVYQQQSTTASKNATIDASDSCVYTDTPVKQGCPCSEFSSDTCKKVDRCQIEPGCDTSSTDCNCIDKSDNPITSESDCSIIENKDDCNIPRISTEVLKERMSLPDSYTLQSKMVKCAWFENPYDSNHEGGLCVNIACETTTGNGSEGNNILLKLYNSYCYPERKESFTKLLDKCFAANQTLIDLVGRINNNTKSGSEQLEYNGDIFAYSWIAGIHIHECAIDIANPSFDIGDEFVITPSYENISLGNSNLKRITLSESANEFLLSSLDLSNNNLTSLPHDFFTKLLKLEDLSLHDNPELKAYVPCESSKNFSLNNTLIYSDLDCINNQTLNNCINPSVNIMSKCCFAFHKDVCANTNGCTWKPTLQRCVDIEEGNISDDISCSGAKGKDECDQAEIGGDRFCTWNEFLGLCINIRDDQPTCADYNKQKCDESTQCVWCQGMCVDADAVNGTSLNGQFTCENVKTGIICQESEKCHVAVSRNNDWKLGSWYCEASDSGQVKTRSEFYNAHKKTSRDIESDTNSCESEDGKEWCDALEQCVRVSDITRKCNCNSYTEVDDCLSLPGCKLCPSSLKCVSKSESSSCQDCSFFTDSLQCISAPNCRYCNGECITKQKPCKTCMVNNKKNCDADDKCKYCESTTQCNNADSDGASICKRCSEIENDKCNYYSNGCKECYGKCILNGSTCEEEARKNSNSVVIIVIVVVVVIAVLCAGLTMFIVKRRNRSEINDAVTFDSSSMVSLVEFTTAELSKTKDFSSPGTAEDSVFLPSEKVSSPEELGIRINATEISFKDEANAGLLTVNKEYRTTFRISRSGKRHGTIILRSSCVERHKITIEPQEVKLKKSGTEVTCTIIMRGSGKLQADLLIGNIKTNKYISIPIVGEAMASCFLSLSDVKIGRQLGAGAYGKVYTGEYRSTPAAIKELGVGELGVGEKDAYEEIDKEMIMMSKLKSPYIVELYGFVYTEKFVYTVMELCKLGTVTSYLKNHKKASRALRLAFCLDAARGVLYLHQNKIIHRDIKPDNLLLVSDSVNVPVRAKVSDFGTSRLVVSENEQALTRATGTPAFMAPEVLEGKSYSLPADIYSLGLTFWSIFTERIPFDDAKNNYEMYQRVERGELPKMPKDEGIAALISKCCAQANKRLKAKDVVAEIFKLTGAKTDEDLESEVGDSTDSTNEKSESNSDVSSTEDD